MKRLLPICILNILLLSSCDYCIWGSINNKTDSDIQITCHLVEKSRWDSLNEPSLSDFESFTGGAYFAVNEINKGVDRKRLRTVGESSNKRQYLLRNFIPK